MPPEAYRELRSFGDAIRSHRKALAVSQEDFAEMCGLHRTYIGQVERGEKNISFVNILKISTALRIKSSELFSSAGQ
jgi:transcriptional regulator with XRE-family HTH domain